MVVTAEGPDAGRRAAAPGRPVAGLDIGSRTIALVEWNGQEVVGARVVNTGTDPMANARAILAVGGYGRLVGTGYGRNLALERELADEVISEIKAYALGAHHLFPDVATVLDIGGQDSKAIRVGPDGRVLRFEMNDRCAAGTGRFLENDGEPVLRTAGVVMFSNLGLVFFGANVMLARALYAMKDMRTPTTTSARSAAEATSRMSRLPPLSGGPS